MRHVFRVTAVGGALSPVFASAQLTEQSAGELGSFIVGLLELINEFLIPLVISLAVLFFVWGVVKYFILGGGDEESRKQGRGFLLHAILGFVAIVALWAIVNFVAGAIFADPTQEMPSYPVGPAAARSGVIGE